MKKTMILLFAFSLLIPLSYAHQPRLVMGQNITESSPMLVSEPDISKAYYAELSGSPAFYRIISNKSFDLYAGILVPDIGPYNQTRFSFDVLDADKNVLFVLDGNSAGWNPFFEFFGGDYYLQGPEIRKTVPAGTYYVKVFNANNAGRYSLVIGEAESFPLSEMINSIITVPVIKQRFFDESFLQSYMNFSGIAIAVSAGVIIIVVIFVFLKTREWKKDKEERMQRVRKKA